MRPTDDWRQDAGCVDVPTDVFYPGDLNRTGPVTAATRESVLLHVLAGSRAEDVADDHGVTARQVRYWLGLVGHDAKTRATDVRPGVDVAKQVCRGCPVRRECLEHALAARETDGVWGGLTPEERRHEIRRRNRRTA